LQCEAETIVRATADTDYFEIFVCQGVVTQHRRFISGKVKKCRTLALGQNGAMRHVSFAFFLWFAY
jgi:hypothetical protein